MIPLYKVNGHELTSLNGKVSSFYQIIPPDIEGKTDLSKKQIFEVLENDLINNKDIIKIYWLNNKLFFNSFGNFNLTYGKVEACHNPLETFIGSNVNDIHFYENYLTSGTQYINILSTRDFPTQLNLLDSIDWPDFVLSIKKIDRTTAKNKINFKRKLHYSNLFKGMRDIESENAYNEAEFLLDGISRGEKSLYNIEFFFIIKANSKVELDKKTEYVIEKFKAIDSTLYREERGLPYFYKTLIPGVEPSFKRANLCPSDYLSYLIPFHLDFVHHSGMKLTSRSGNQLHVDIFDKVALNYNVLITGSSGQGKSMLANKLLATELGSKTKAIVLDLGNSFQKTTKFYKGAVLSKKFNPLQFKNPRYLKEFILAAIDEKMSKKDEGKLFARVSDILTREEIKSFADLIDQLENDFKGISFYFSEIEEYFTNETLLLNDLTYCDFSNYPDSIKAPLIIYLIEYFKNLTGKRLIIFDECWHLLSKNADYIAECFRTFRKHNASAIAISQNLDDFSVSQLGRVIIQNTYWKFMFRQSLMPSEFIDTQAIELINSIQSKKGAYSEFLLFSEDYKKPMRFYPSHLEYQLFTSDREDNNKLLAYIDCNEKYLSFNEAIINFTKLKHPHWEYSSES